jgi:hypothetical protein
MKSSGAHGGCCPDTKGNFPPLLTSSAAGVFPAMGNAEMIKAELIVALAGVPDDAEISSKPSRTLGSNAPISPLCRAVVSFTRLGKPPFQRRCADHPERVRDNGAPPIAILPYLSWP